MNADAMDDLKRLLEYARKRPEVCADDVARFYEQIRKQIEKEIKFSDLSLVRMVKTLLNLYHHDRALFEFFLLFLAAPMQPVTGMGELLHVSKSTSYRRLRRLALENPEIKMLIRLRRAETMPKNRKHEELFPGQRKKRVLPED